MTRRNCLDGVDVLVLAGGLGTRIQSVLGSTPKVLAPINGRPYLDHLLDCLAGFGAPHVVLSLGHLAEAVVSHVAGRDGIECAVEPEPMGTGGAIRFTREALRSDIVMVMNGDTWADTDLCAFVQAHVDEGVDVSVLCVPVDDVSRYGSISLVGNRIARYVEKSSENSGPGLISGGVYLFTQKALDDVMMTKGPSVERDFLQTLASSTVHGYVPKAVNFIDIGTPESLQAAAGVFLSEGH